jgi:CheY-like chemotaxis protein
LRCTLTIPHSKIERMERFVPTGNGSVRPETPVPHSLQVAGNRILAVEDEPLVAAMLRDALTDLGSPSSAQWARSPRRWSPPERFPSTGAILDVNVASEAISVADALAARGIPFIFITGYQSDGIDPLYAHVPALQKPIDTQGLRHIFARGTAGGGAQT